MRARPERCANYAGTRQGQSRAAPSVPRHPVRGDTVCAIPVFPTGIHDEKGDRVVLRHDRAKFQKRQRIVFDFGQFRRGPPFAHYKYDNLYSPLRAADGL